jgi:hypothetical protein
MKVRVTSPLGLFALCVVSAWGCAPSAEQTIESKMGLAAAPRQDVEEESGEPPEVEDADEAADATEEPAEDELGAVVDPSQVARDEGESTSVQQLYVAGGEVVPAPRGHRGAPDGLLHPMSSGGGFYGFTRRGLVVVSASGLVRETSMPGAGDSLRLEAVTDAFALWYDAGSEELVLVNLENDASVPIMKLCGAPSGAEMTARAVYWKTSCGDGAWRRADLSTVEVVEELPRKVSRKVQALCVDRYGAVARLRDGYVRWDDGARPMVVPSKRPGSCLFARTRAGIAWSETRAEGDTVVVARSPDGQGEVLRVQTAATPSGVQLVDERAVTWLEDGRVVRRMSVGPASAEARLVYDGFRARADASTSRRGRVKGKKFENLFSGGGDQKTRAPKRFGAPWLGEQPQKPALERLDLDDEGPRKFGSPKAKRSKKRGDPKKFGGPDEKKKPRKIDDPDEETMKRLNL